MIVYDKLVRDRIPEIIMRSGKTCEIETLSDAEYLRRAEEKLDEELKEFHESRDVMELADLLEIIYAVSEALGTPRARLDALREEKARERGGFRDKILLKSVREANE